MKTLKLSLTLVCLSILTAAVAFGADAVAVAPAAPSFMAWFAANENGLLKFALAVTEFLGLFTAFKGNGILDTIVKGLKALYDAKNSTPPTV